MVQSSHVPKYLIQPCIERGDGVGPVIELGPLSGKLLRLTVGINDMLEQEGLAISIWGSASGSEWGASPLLSLPQKSYCGEYHSFLNLANRPGIRCLRVEWKMNRWGKRETGLMFGFYVAVDEARSHVSTAVA